MKHPAPRERRFHPPQLLAVSFIVAILVGTLLLLFPFCTKSGRISFVDALFAGTSAVCVTGLTVQNTATFFTPAGQAVILVLLQLGGLGIMTFSTLILLVAGKKVTIKDRIIIQRGFHHVASRDVRSLIKNIFIYTLCVEFLGVLLLFLRWQRDFVWLKALFVSLFHSISAFCNAGFSLFANNLVLFRGDAWVNLTFILLIVLGGFGFLVLQETKDIVSRIIRRKRFQVSLHAKMVYLLTAFLIFFSFIFLFLIEWNHSSKSFTVQEKIFSSIFQVITPRTAGFNTVDLNSLSFASIFLLMMLMFIGASPGSTGGGIKTSTAGVIFAFMKSNITARESTNLFRRTLPVELITRAFTLVTLAVGVIFLSTFILLLTHPGAGMREALFEVFSAFGTVGLSLGMTEKLNTVGKIVIIFTMYIGRIGPLTLLYAFSRQRAFGRFEYVEETVMIG